MLDQAIIEDEELIAEEVEPDQYVVFTARSQEYGFQAMRVQEITQVLPVSYVPNAPSYIEGIMNLRGRIASVINFRKKFGFEPKEQDEDTRIIVVELDNCPIGILVDSVEEVVKIPDDSVQKLPLSTTTSESQEHITGIGMKDKRLIILLDLDKVLVGTVPVNMSEINKAIDERKLVETQKQTTMDAVQSFKPVTAETNMTKRTDKIQDNDPGVKTPVDTTKKQIKRRTK